MRFLANENFPLKSIRLLRENGFDVIAVSEEMAGEKDRAILEHKFTVLDRERIRQRSLP
jgi:hypothetical protein